MMYAGHVKELLANLKTTAKCLIIGHIHPLTSHKFEQKSNLQVEIFNFYTGDYGFVGDSWF